MLLNVQLQIRCSTLKQMFEVSTVCLDEFFDSCDQRICNRRKHCSVVDASCSAENSREYFLSRVHLVCIHNSFALTPHMVILMGSNPVTVVANLCTATTNPSILEFIIQILPYDLTEMRLRSVMLVVHLSSCL
jgi:hypothetical protein